MVILSTTTGRFCVIPVQVKVNSSFVLTTLRNFPQSFYRVTTHTADFGDIYTNGYGICESSLMITQNAMQV